MEKYQCIYECGAVDLRVDWIDLHGEMVEELWKYIDKS